MLLNFVKCISIQFLFSSQKSVRAQCGHLAMLYHIMLNCYMNHGVGYGIISMQGKESLHSAVKQQLRTESNRSTVENSNGKWHQIMRSSYVRNFYLPYHFPLTPAYHSHYRSRKAVFEDVDDVYCSCSRNLNEFDICETCRDASEIVTCAEKGIKSHDVLKALKPIVCRECGERFADLVVCDSHVKTIHRSKKNIAAARQIVPTTMSVLQLKAHLK